MGTQLIEEPEERKYYVTFLAGTSRKSLKTEQIDKFQGYNCFKIKTTNSNINNAHEKRHFLWVPTIVLSFNPRMEIILRGGVFGRRETAHINSV
jgi:hypothetical protein